MSSIPRSPAAAPNRALKMASNQALDLNQLLNFTLPPRQSRTLTNLPRRGRRTGNIQGVWNKERFLNAQYRFMMNPTGDYTVHFADPDMHEYSYRCVYSYFQWHDIMQVIIPRSSAVAHAAASGDLPTQGEGPTTCPICLSPPTAPRMTKCGHVFCFACMLQYLNMSDNKWARCPICFDSVSEKQLKPVKWFDTPVAQEGETDASTSLLATADDSVVTAPRTGSILQMRLVQRPQITTLALPRSHTWPSELVPPHQAPFYFLPDVFAFSKFMLATPASVVADLTKDLDNLEAERRVLAGMNDSLAISFIDGAEQKIRHEIARVAALDSPQLQERIEKATRDLREIEERSAIRSNPQVIPKALDEVPTEFLALKGQGVGAATHSQYGVSITAPGASQVRNAPKQRKNLNPPPPSTNTYFYYQAASGLPIFLHPLDIRILLSHFSSYSSFPDNVSVRVEAYSEGTVNDDLRKRCKYLAHMPEGADVVFIEADVSGVVGPEGLKNFETALKMRSARRKGKGRKDERAKARAEERERERERAHAATWSTGSPSFEPPAEGGNEVEQFPPTSQAQHQLQQSAATPGAWGSRSFASALHTPPSQARATQRTNTANPREEDHDYWDELAWDELERSVNSGGRKKRSAKLILNSGGAGRRR
ncbi:hypothetical protein M378DRAFT_64871 [Amanita muscaria Koide BX008]|uniref:RING-type domain-containing protein n=1 Tax=Amanita muscaria (strain Koide BX008) TaxID=946122 RepID=A0A0C2TW39_AMAMK|nr:hypothetical protein M378DRAFT_64871 [Amanita muscaria Koide BX008]